MELLKDLGMLYPTETSKHKARYGLYLCPLCNKGFKTMTTMVKQGRSTKCRSCQVGIKNTTHGMSKDKNHARWVKMMDRCYNNKSDNFTDYGARGITVAPELQDPEYYCNYVATLENANKEGFTIDRKDNSKNYSLDNLRWVNWTFQNTNQRKKKSSNYKYLGVYRMDKSKKYAYRIRAFGKRIYKGGFSTQEEAAKARDSFIILNKLPHVLTGVQ